MHQQRQNLSETRQQLFTITGPLLAAQRFEEEKKVAAANFGGLNFLGHGSPSSRQEGRDNDEDDESQSSESELYDEPVQTGFAAAFRKSIAPGGALSGLG